MLSRRYGALRADIDAVISRQGGCAICGTTKVRHAGYRNGWHVDHDHSCCPGDMTCGKCIRGVLCSRCNKLLGMVGDSSSLLRRAAEYVGRDWRHRERAAMDRLMETEGDA